MFEVLRSPADSAERLAVRGRSVYVVVSTDGWTKRPLPGRLRTALERARDIGASPSGTAG
ncbi:hypothetical protein KEK_20378 [Mycolicibacterium thermoresistibile ATCC 19527]|uniref:Thioesterase superfamily protein n=2 Tax=Mycolicibacterium thermoresistibile TaxID=1797 RepID=G7CM31_MYCT3|nr:hypothetical protein KEK_20378 [Mycolicibacterium thermoresistibile ATCC 19527]GAT13333.1 thioesterase superfamily protein [Mycolicibacterium thermoresistibile]SNW18492.1 putative thioesterase [Mycolicibacterium thermoresistibile]